MRGGVSVVQGEVSQLLSAVRKTGRWSGHARTVSMVLATSATSSIDFAVCIVYACFSISIETEGECGF